MAVMSFLAQFWRLSWRDRALLAEALVFLAAACIALRLVPLTAHAWTYGTENVVGGAGAERFTPLTAFGPRT